MNSSGGIQIQLTVTELVEQTQNKYSEDCLAKITLLQAKASTGFKDVQGFIKSGIVTEKPFKIAVIIGKSEIIDNDIKHQLKGVEQLKAGAEQLQNEKLTLLNEQISAFNAEVKTLEKKPAVNWGYIIAAIAIGLIIGYLLKGR